jgi:serine/threonine protein kinase
MQASNPPSDNSKIDVLIASYLEAIERGELPDRQRLLAAHPEDAESLAIFFANLDKIEATKLHERYATDMTFVPQHEPKPGAIFGGRYKLLENIGEGGMGSVWVAEQLQPVKRRVAIKLVKAGMDSKQVLARFEAERQALAIMDHPNIAKVFDGGISEQGRPYFVMEYVKGMPFTEYCDKARLSLKERLNLFIPVCQAVQHAHHKGIVHRDLKPSNILICLYDGKPIPKVIDFGLAKAMHQSLTDQSIYTGHGIMVGTPLYMSPEQAEHNNLDVDTRTDIYSLGVVLYELLVGTTPLERQQLQKAAFEEVLRLIKEVEPPRPSLRLSTSASLGSIAAQRSIDPKQLSRSLAGDLDWIVMKSLEKERSRRYETAAGLARDIERFLNDDAVEACPPSRAYQLKKFLKKHRGQVITAIVIFFALIVGITGATWGWLRASTAELAASNSERKALNALVDVTQERDAKEVQRQLAEAAKLAESEQRNNAERQLANGLLRPIGFGEEPNATELRCFADWSGISDARLKIRILEVALEDPEVALRVARRAERVIQSSVGLSPTRRSLAIRLLSARQRDLQADPRIRVAAAWLAFELASTDIPALPESLTWLSKPGASGPNPRSEYKETEYKEFVEFMNGRVETLTSEQINLAWDGLISILELLEQLELKWNERNFTYDATEDGLVALVPKLSPEKIKQGGNALINILEKSKDEFALKAASSILAVLAPKLSPDQITHGWDAMIGIFEKDTTSDMSTHALPAAAKGVEAFAPRLRSDQILHGWNAIVSKAPSIVSGAGDGLVALSQKLPPEEIMRAWDVFLRLAEKSTNPSTSSVAGNGLVALTPKLTSEQISQAWDALVRIVENPEHVYSARAAGVGLVSLAPKLSPEQAARRGDAFILFLEKLRDDYAMVHDHDAMSSAAAGLVALAPKLSPEQIARTGDALIDILPITGDKFSSYYTANQLLIHAPNLSPEQIRRGGDTVIQILEKAEDDIAVNKALIVLVALAPKLSHEQITKSIDALLGIFQNGPHQNPHNFKVVSNAARGLVALAPQLNPEQLMRTWDVLFGVLQETMMDDQTLGAAANCLVAITPQLIPDQIMRNRDALFGVLETSDSCFTLGAAGNCLVALTPMLSPDTRIRTAELFVRTLKRENGRCLTEQLLAVMKHLDLPTQDRIATEVMSILLDDQTWSADVTLIGLNPFWPGAMAMINGKSLASMLQHPSITGPLRDAMLQRFEELVLHDGQHVFLTLKEPNAKVQTSDPTKQHPVPPRQFHNLHDASDWIQKNWPGFDLEATYPVTWRGK